jgi:hypothetical protein
VIDDVQQVRTKGAVGNFDVVVPFNQQPSQNANFSTGGGNWSIRVNKEAVGQDEGRQSASLRRGCEGKNSRESGRHKLLLSC